MPTTPSRQRSGGWPNSPGEVEPDQILLSASASADFLLAAWFLWMTPLLAALSSLRLVATSNSVALSFSPASTASRNPRTAVRSDDLTDWLRCLRRSLVRMRFFCDLMLATRVCPSKAQLG